MDTISTKYPFLKGGGEMGELTRNYDWENSSLGPISQWPLSLKNTVGIILHSAFPMFLLWGEDLICFYNDAFRPSFGQFGKHPALGKEGKEVWAELWDFAGPLLQQVMATGEPVYFENQPVPFYRDGETREVFWTFSYSPVYDEGGNIMGVFVTCVETTEKTHYIKQLESSKEELEFAIEATELGVFDLDPKTGKFSGNARLKEWFGLTPDEHIPLELATNVIATVDRERIVNAINTTLDYASGGRYDEEYTIINPSTKKPRIVKAKGRAWFDDSNIAYRFNGTLQDITQNIEAQQEIAETNKLNSLILKSAGIGLFTVDLLTGQIEYNREFATILTGDPDKKELSRKAFENYLHPDDLADRQAALIEGAKTNEFHYSPRIIWDDGSVHRINVMATNTLDASGKPVIFSGTVKDISILEDQRRALENAEALKRDADAMFRNVTNSSPTGLWLSDETGGVIYVNRILMEWTGYTFSEFMGTGWSESIIEEDRQQCIDSFVASISSKIHFDVFFRLQKADGNIIWCRAAGDPYYTSDNEFAGYAGYVLDIDEIIEGRQALMESEERFRNMIDQAPVATCLFTGPDMRIDVANEIMLGFWGTDKSAIGKALVEAVPELTGQSFPSILKEVYETGIAYEAKSAMAVLKQNGVLGTYYFDFTYKPLFDTKGKVYGIIDMAVDVTEQVLAQQRIADSQKQILDSFEQSPVGIAILGRDKLTFTMANPFYADLVGRERDTLIDQPLLDILPELRGQGFEMLIEEVIATGTPYTATEVAVNIMRGNRLETIYVDLTYQPRYNIDRSISGVLVVATDVTQQVLTRKKIETAQAALTDAIELAELATWRFNIKDNTFTFSERFMEWLGFEGTTKSIEEVYNTLPADHIEQVDDSIRAALIPGTSGRYESEHPVINHVTGQIRIIHAQAQILYDAEGNPEFLSGNAQNVTKERKLQQELEFLVKQRTEELEAANTELEAAINALQQNNMELQQFAYIASHDLQEPTRKISMFSKMLLQNLGKIDDRSALYLNKINSSAERMGNLISDILAYSQLSKNSDLIEMVDLNSIVSDCVTDFELIIDESEAEIHTENLPAIEGIPRQMSQLFANLISNSLKYRLEDTAPVIRITSELLSSEAAADYNLDEYTGYYRIEFTDNGIGFNQEYADKIFNIFQRLHGKSEYSGTGIGLSICKKIVQNHHGHIEASSAKGSGAKFIVILPAVQHSDNEVR